MKRRNAECGKLRRPIKRTKITEGIYGSTFVYVKFLMVWALVLMADFILEFRFEYLWPFWLLLRSVYDSFKYQGLAFSVFFICVAVTSDVVCYLFIPVQWLFFCASTYVWVQYVWHTERGICLPTVSLWLLFVYIEASIRLREIKTFPFNMDLCRPFAAHCIGYPVVTLGFGFKSYISYRFRLRKQKDVEKENEFYMQLLQQALPTEMQNQDKQKELPSNSKEESISATTTTNSTTSDKNTGHSNTAHQNGAVPSAGKHEKKSSTPSSTANTTTAHSKNDSSSQQHTTAAASTTSATSASDKADAKDLSNSSNISSSNSSNTSSSNSNSSKHSKQTNNSSQHYHNSNHHHQHIEDFEYIENSLPPKRHNVNDYEEENLENERNSAKYSSSSSKQHNGVAGGKNHHHGGGSGQSSKLNSHNNNTASSGGVANTANATHTSSNKKGKNNYTASVYSNNKDEFIARMETDVKKLKADLQSSRNTEQELRSQLNSYSLSEKQVKNEIQQLQQDNESLQNKLHNLVTCRQQDKQNLSALEKKLQEERKTKSTLEQQLASERKAKKEEAAKASSRSECTESCKNRRRELENEIQESRRQSMLWEGQTRQLERETQTLRQYKEAQNESEVLMSALAAMQDKNTHLENSLSAENRLKQDLFSALGDAKRQIEIQKGLLAQKDLELAELKVKMAEVISLIPSMTNFPVVVSTTNNTPLHFSGNFTPPPTSQHLGSFTPPQSSTTPPPPSPGSQGQGDDVVVANSSLNPNASDYTPKMSQ